MLVEGRVSGCEPCPSRPVKANPSSAGPHLDPVANVACDDSMCPGALPARGVHGKKTKLRRQSDMKRAIVAIAFGLGAAVAATGASAQATLNAVKQRGMLVCGSNTGLPGFGIPDA